MTKSRTLRTANDDGFTLVEMLIAVILLAALTGAVATAFALTVRTGSAASDRIRKSNDSQSISAFLVKDAASAGTYGADNDALAATSGLTPGVVIGASGASFCADIGTPLARFEWLEQGSTGNRRVAAAYGWTGTQLLRRGCSQTLGTGAPPATASTATLVRNLASVSVSCSPTCAPGQQSPLPLSVTLNVAESVSPGGDQTPFSYSVTGLLRTGGDGRLSAQNVALLALGIPADVATSQCPTPPTTPVPSGAYRTSGVGINSGSEIKVDGIAAINSIAGTTGFNCGRAANMQNSSALKATQLVTQTGAACTNCPPSVELSAAIVNPYENLPPAPGAACIPGGTNPGFTTEGGARHYFPNTYHSNLTLSGALDVRFEPGIYIFCAGLTVSSVSFLSTEIDDVQDEQEGVLFVFRGGSMTVESGLLTIVDLEGLPETHPSYPDMLIWQQQASSPGIDATLRLSASSVLGLFNSRYDGVIYAPQAQVTYTGGLAAGDGGSTLGVVARNVYAGPNVRMRVGPGPQSTTALTVTPNPSTLGQEVVLRAVVSPVAPETATPTGTVAFRDNGVQIGTANVMNGVATFATSSLSGGEHSFVAAYGGNGLFASSVSAVETQVVSRATSTLALTSSPNPSGFGQAATFVATVGGIPAVTPGGTVTFFEGTTALGPPVAVTAARTATLTRTDLALGMHNVTAVYSGDNSYLGSTSDVRVHEVRLASAISLTSDASIAFPGQAVTFTVAVSAPGAPPNAPSLAGTVTFLDNGVAIPNGAVAVGAGGGATFTTSFATAGTHVVTAQYGGNTAYAGSAAILPVTVGRQNSSVSVSGNPNPSGLNQTVVITAIVSPSGSDPQLPTPTGTVTFEALSPTSNLGTATLSGGQAQVSISNLAITSGRTIRATYNPPAVNPPYFPSSSTYSQVVVRAQTRTEITQISPTPPSSTLYGAPMQFRAVVSVISGSCTPTGTVTFLQDDNFLGTGAVSLTSGEYRATLTTTGVLGGTHEITARFEQTTNCATSSSDLGVITTVGAAPTSGSITRPAANSSMTSVWSEALSFRATFASTTGAIPVGTVVFRIDGSPVTGNLALDSQGRADCAAACSAMVVSSTAHQVSAVFTPTNAANFTGSTSANRGHTVNKASATVELSRTNGSDTSSTAGSSQIFLTEVSLNSPAAGTPAGTVTISDALTGTIYGPFTLNGSGDYTFPAVTLSTGTHALTATFTPNSATTANVNGDTDSLNHVVSKITSTLSLALAPGSSDPSRTNQNVSFRATITPASPGPDGSVTFTARAGSVTVASGSANIVGNVATYTFNAGTLPGDDYVVTATWAGDADYNGDSDTENHDVDYPNAPAITGFSPSSGGRGTTITTFTVNGSGLQPGATLTFGNVSGFCNAQPSAVVNPTQLGVPGSLTFTVTIPSNASTSCRRTIRVTNTDGQQSNLFGSNSTGFQINN